MKLLSIFFLLGLLLSAPMGFSQENFSFSCYRVSDGAPISLNINSGREIEILTDWDVDGIYSEGKKIQGGGWKSFRSGEHLGQEILVQSEMFSGVEGFLYEISEYANGVESRAYKCVKGSLAY